MDFDRIKLLLDVLHSSLTVPNTDRIRAAIMSELAEHNTDADLITPTDPEPELTAGGRRL